VRSAAIEATGPNGGLFMNTQPTTVLGPRQPVGQASMRIGGLQRSGDEEAALPSFAMDTGGPAVRRRSRAT
jgi:hypothetical protein